MSEIQVFTDSQLALRVVMLQALADHINREFRYAKGELAERMARGDRLTARDGASKLGSVSLSDPKPVATVSDEAAFRDYMSVKYGDEAQAQVELGDAAEICAVLADTGHEDLFSVREVFPDWVRENALRDALVREVPGVTVTTPAGVLSACTEEAAVEAVKSAISSSGVLAIEGGAA
ncbi:hypothetical protein MWT96_20455 [Prescottella equi]|uniref:hypothetical protein n=1 Tax=Rhodococcus hoagii TaxID=43767 RepID=UPI001FFC480F|nr:hypothetical protein [Prescottella equi]UPH40841.1 hypothetical protein MWT96_20455 [Prescottella equi]